MNNVTVMIRDRILGTDYFLITETYIHIFIEVNLKVKICIIKHHSEISQLFWKNLIKMILNIATAHMRKL